MNTAKDAIRRLRDLRTLVQSVDRAGQMLSELSKELREQDRRLVRLETRMDIAEKGQSSSKK